MPLNELTHWLKDRDPTRFPYDAVTTAYLRTGKHFVGEDLLRGLIQARQALAEAPDPNGGSELLRRFLRSALDKCDGTYEYASYIGLPLLPIPSVDDPPEQLPHALRRRDRLLVQLIADLLEFELAAADGRADQLPKMRPDPRTSAKRYRLAMHAAAPALRRLGMSSQVSDTDPERCARQMCTAVEPEQSVLDRRILQLFEATFALIAVQLRGAVHAMAGQDGATAAGCVDVAQATLRESAPLFSLLATMQVEAFRMFRDLTEGSSAIQSRNYKIMESLCCRPETARLESAAYRSVPEVQRQVLAGHATLDDMFTSACTGGWLDPAGRIELTAAMEAFAETVLRWRTTHYRIALRMIGKRSGTGYTEGTTYLKEVQNIPVFRSIDQVERGAYR